MIPIHLRGTITRTRCGLRWAFRTTTDEKAATCVSCRLAAARDRPKREGLPLAYRVGPGWVVSAYGLALIAARLEEEGDHFAARLVRDRLEARQEAARARIAARAAGSTGWPTPTTPPATATKETPDGKRQDDQ